jgi:hypothetical protein
MNPAVAVITLNWNGWHDTIECLKSLYQMDYGSCQIVVVDNASTDESLAKIDWYCTNELKFVPHFTEARVRDKPIKVTQYTKGHPSTSAQPREMVEQPKANHVLTVIQNDCNYGFAEGNNIGVAYALSCFNPDYVLLLNNDAVASQCFLNALVNAAENDEQIGLIQPKLLRYADATIDNTGNVCDRLVYCEPRGLGETDTGQYDNDQKQEFFYASGACVLINRRLLSALSGQCFDPCLFAYYEDVDLSWAARLIGFKVAYCPESVCYHKGNATFGGRNPFTDYLNDRNRLRVMIKNYELRTLVFVLPFTAALKLAILAVESIIGLDYRHPCSFFKALLWNAQHFRSTLTARRGIQSKRKVPDSEIISRMIPFSFKASLKLMERWAVMTVK